MTREVKVYLNGKENVSVSTKQQGKFDEELHINIDFDTALKEYNRRQERMSITSNVILIILIVISIFISVLRMLN